MERERRIERLERQEGMTMERTKVKERIGLTKKKNMKAQGMI